MSSYKCILLVYVKKFSSGHYRIFYRRETVICMGLFDSMKDNMERRQRTREYLKNAKEYINDGEELYQNAYEKVLKRADKTRDAIRNHVEYLQKMRILLLIRFGKNMKRTGKFILKV